LLPAATAVPSARTPTECLAELGVSADCGLSSDEAAARLLRHGPNELERHAPPSVWKLVLEQLDDTLVHILLAAAVVSFVLALYDGAEGGEARATAFVEPLVIFLILIVNTVVGVWQESNAEKALKEIQSEHATVKRDGRWPHALPARDLVVGDVVELRQPLAGGGAAVDWRARVWLDEGQQGLSSIFKYILFSFPFLKLC
jgi:magnesium-transporting ATPase (P-type)